MAVRNGERYLAEAIESVLRQEDVDLELIVVDDGSTDATSAVLREALRDPRTTVVRQPAGGVGRARNVAIAHARAPFVAFLDADDVWLPGKLARQLAVFAAHPGLAMTLTAYVTTDDALRPRGLVATNDIRAWLELDGHGPALPSTAMVSRSVVGHDLHFDEGLSMAADVEFALRVAACGPVRTLRAPLTLYRFHPDQMSGSLDALTRDFDALWGALRSSGLASGERRARANLHVRLMARAAARRRLGELAQHLRVVLRSHPAALLVLPARAVGRRGRRRVSWWLAARRARQPSEASRIVPSGR